MPGGHDGGSGPTCGPVGCGALETVDDGSQLGCEPAAAFLFHPVGHGPPRCGHRCGYGCLRVGVAAQRDGQPHGLLNTVCIEEGRDGLGHGAPARHIPRVARPYLADGAAQVVAETVFHVSPYLAVAGPVARHEHRRGHGPGRPDGLGMVVRHLCRHRGQPQCLVEGGGIKPSRAHAHGRAVAPAAVGLGVVGGQPAGEGRPIACVGILAAQFLHGFNERGRALVAAVCQPPGHGERHHRVVGEAARGHEQRYLAWVAELQQARLVGRACHVSNYCS